MTEKSTAKVEALPDLDDLLQCPVCYEIPSGQIFQCNEGHHVCGRCKMRLDVCPVCRAFFFGTRNYAMEELIANVRKLQAFKLGGKVTTGAVEPNDKDSSSEDNESTHQNEEEEETSSVPARAPSACKGLFRCLCCKNNPERLPAARLLNHLRYYHSPDLIEGRSENEEYVQAWQFPTIPGRIVTAVRVSDMGIFFLIIEITDESVHSWMQMAASPWVSNEFYYTFTLSGNDREAIFSDFVWSVRSCEGALKKRGRCLSVAGADARALLQPSAMCGKLSLRRTSRDQLIAQTEPRAVLRVANRSRQNEAFSDALQPFLQDLRNDVLRLSHAFAAIGSEAIAAEAARQPAPSASVAARAVVAPPPAARAAAAPAPATRAVVAPAPAPRANPPQQPAAPRPQEPVAPPPQMSRREARRMRHRVGVALATNELPEPRRGGDAPVVRSDRAVDATPRAVDVRPPGDSAPDRSQNSNVAQNANRNVSNNNNNNSRPQNPPAALPNTRADSGSIIAHARSRLITNQVRRAPAPAPSLPPQPVPTPPPVADDSSQLGLTIGNNTRNKRRRRNRR